MTDLMTFSTEELKPDTGAVLENQGIALGDAVPARIEALCVEALGLLLEAAAPSGILREISKGDFEIVYDGEGRNEPRTPVGNVLAGADDLACFVVTLGDRISRGIERRFAANELALACMLDSVASASADKLAGIAERRFFDLLVQSGRVAPDTGVLRYSPGYCGWDMSGQRKLFEFLRPERIGISLKDSFLMQPLKSVSGVIISGRREIHSFEDSYPFCSQCETHGCRERIRTLLTG